MNALGMLVLGNAGTQVALARTNITVVGKPLPVVQALLRTALRAPSVAERAAGDSVLRRLCCRNEDVQLELLGTISPVEPGKRRVMEEEKREEERARKLERERAFFLHLSSRKNRSAQVFSKSSHSSAAASVCVATSQSYPKHAPQQVPCPPTLDRSSCAACSTQTRRWLFLRLPSRRP